MVIIIPLVNYLYPYLVSDPLGPLVPEFKEYIYLGYHYILHVWHVADPQLNTGWINKCTCQSNPCRPKITLKGTLSSQRENGHRNVPHYHSCHLDSSPALHGD